MPCPVGASPGSPEGRGRNMRKLHTLIVIVLSLLVLVPPAAAQEPDDPEKYLLLATSRTGTMEEELNEAGARGYRFLATQGGETAFGGSEAVVVMTLDPKAAGSATSCSRRAAPGRWSAS